jgi:peptide/nickel transport system substrate-binding protein
MLLTLAALTTALLPIKDESAALPAAPPAAPTAPAAAGDTLAIGVTGPITSLHPNAATFGENYLRSFGHRPLSAPDMSWSTVCFLCTTLPTIENGLAKVAALPKDDDGEGMDVSFALRPDARWADGVPVSTRDVVFTWQVGRTADIGYPSQEIFRHISDVTVLDDKRFILHYDRVNYQFNLPYSFEILPEHVEGPIFAGLADKRRYREFSAYTVAPTTPGLWLGPYRLARYERGHEAVFERNPYWTGHMPGFARIVARIYPSAKEATAALAAGQVDVLQEGVMQYGDAVALAQDADRQLDVRPADSTSYTHIEMNLTSGPLTDRRVRQALLLALDRDGLAKSLFGDSRFVAHSFLAPHDPGYDPDIHRYPCDPAQATALLQAAGYHRDADGAWYDPSGKRFGFTLSVPAPSPKLDRVASLVTAQWQRFGVAVEITRVPTLYAVQLPHRNFDAALFSWNVAPEYPPESMFRGDAVPAPANNFAGQNYSGLDDRRMDVLLDDLTVELNPFQRLNLWKRIQALYADVLPALPLFDMPEMYVVPDWLTGFKPTGHWLPASAYAEFWGRRALP